MDSVPQSPYPNGTESNTINFHKFKEETIKNICKTLKIP
jgi:hypothetical protein